MKENFVLTVSRQYGSGGRELTVILAEKLKVKLYDRRIVHIAAIKLGLDDLIEEEFFFPNLKLFICWRKKNLA